MFRKRGLISGVICVGLMGLWASIATGLNCEQELTKYCPATTNAGESFDCAKKHMERFSQECQSRLNESLNMYSALKRECESDLKKYCGIGFQELGGAQKEKRAQCVVENWGQLKSECQQVLTQQVPYLGLLQQSTDAPEEVRFGKDYKMKKLSGNGKKVKMVYEKDGTVWYLADLVKKNIVEEYEFCPEINNPRYRRLINFKQPSCFYEVKAAWGEELINRLINKGLLVEISYLGLRNRGNRITDTRILSIVDEYEKNCPSGFEVDVVYSINNENQKWVYCQRKEWFDCPSGWYRTSPKKERDFFGCQRYASCEQTNPISYEIGDPQYCAVCQAGGCIDSSKTETDWSNIKIGYCQVNEARPEQTLGCNKKSEF